MKGICVHADYGTGMRAGGVRPDDPNLRCHPTWQNLKAGCEFLLVLDGNVEPYRNVEGIRVFETEAEVRKALEMHIGERVQHGVTSEAILQASLGAAMAAGKIKADELPQDHELCCEFMHGHGIAGLKCRRVTPHDPVMVLRKAEQDAADAIARDLK